MEKAAGVWSGASYLKTTFQEGEGIIINFKFTQGELFEIYLNDGAWATNSYKRFGIYLDRGDAYPNFIIGEEGLDFNHLPGNLYPKPDRWYSLFMVIGKGGDFLALIWDTANPEKVIRYREKVEKWKELTWTFHIQVNERMIVFDNFEEIEFDGIK